jgi:hypothetical protein
MGGTTQSKFAFISTTIKKKNEDMNKSKTPETEEKAKVTKFSPSLSFFSSLPPFVFFSIFLS